MNDYSTFAEMIKGYRSMARIFHPDNNYGFETTEMMTMINMARYGLQYQLREYDELRGKNVSKQQKMRVQFHLITILIPNQAVHHPNQCHHILDHRHPKKI